MDSTSFVGWWHFGWDCTCNRFDLVSGVLEVVCTYFQESILCISFQLRLHKEILKLAIMGVFTPKKSENAVYQEFPPPGEPEVKHLPAHHWALSGVGYNEGVPGESALLE